jgi:hypothetical protein
MQQSQGAASGGELDETATPLTVEQVQVGNPVPQQPQPTIVLSREYIWGPGDGAAGVDELFVQFDANRKPWWVLQDAGGDIVALCENASGIESPATVAAQWTYDAYGSVLSADHLAAHPFMHAGHKGLFFDRREGINHSTQRIVPPIAGGAGDRWPVGRSLVIGATPPVPPRRCHPADLGTRSRTKPCGACRADPPITASKGDFGWLALD